MNVYEVSCLEFGDTGNIFSNPEKAVNYLHAAYSEAVDLKEPKAITARTLRTKGYADFELLDNNGEIVSLRKIKVC